MPQTLKTFGDILFASVGAGAGVLDAEMKYVRVNAALAAMNGRTPEEHVGRHLRDVLSHQPREALDLLEGMLARVIDEGLAITDLSVVVRTDRGNRHFLASYWPVRDSVGAIAGVAAYVVEQTPAEAALREVEALSRQLFVLSPLPTWVYDRESLYFLEVNEAAVQHYGYSYEEFRAMRLHDLRPAEDVPHLLEAVSQPQPVPSTRGIFRHKRKSGEIIDVEVFSQDIERGGKPAGIVVVQDITERRRVERALQEASAQATAARAEAERERDRASRLQALTAALAGAHSVKDVANVVVAEAAAATQALSGALVVRDSQDESVAFVVGHTGLTDQVMERYGRIALDIDTPSTSTVRSGTATFVESLDELFDRFPQMSDTWKSLGNRAVAAVPVRGGDVIGAMSFTFAEERTFSDKDRAFFEALGREASRALDRAHLLEAEKRARLEAQEARRRVEFLAHASARFAVSLDVEQTLRAVADAAVPSLADWCFVEVLEHGRVRTAAVAHSDPDKVHLAYEILSRYPVRLDAPMGTGKVLRTGEPELIPVIPPEAFELVAQDEAHLDALRSVAFLSSMSVPLKDTEGRAIAVLSLVSSTPGRHYGMSDLQMAQEVAHRASASLASARLYAAGQAALRRANALQRVSSELAGALTAIEVARVIVHYGLEAVGASAGTVAVLDDDCRYFHSLASEGYPAQSARRYERFPVVAGRPLSDVVLHNSPVFISCSDDLKSRYPEMEDAFRETGLMALAAFPLHAAGELPVGALGFSFSERAPFDAEERTFLETLATQAGQALARARLVEAERAARAEAEAANRAKGQFLATMSHELRTPLNAIGGHVQLMEIGLHGPVTPAQAEALARVQRAQRHLLGLINDVLNYARVESGRVEYDMRSVLVRDVVADVLPLIEPQVKAKRIDLEVNLGGSDDVAMWADREKVGQVLLNLLSNAMKFTEAGGRITIAARHDSVDSRVVHLSVTDTGAGIPADKLDAIFEPFVQVGRSYTNVSGGTGLGLAISRDLARGMGGDLSVTSEQGKGSTFTFTAARTRVAEPG